MQCRCNDSGMIMSGIHWCAWLVVGSFLWVAHGAWIASLFSEIAPHLYMVTRPSSTAIVIQIVITLYMSCARMLWLMSCLMHPPPPPGFNPTSHIWRHSVCHMETLSRPLVPTLVTCEQASCTFCNDTYICSYLGCTRLYITEYDYMLVVVSLQDEPFHIPQTQNYCNGRWDVWDPKITTLPGLYLFGAAYAHSLKGITSALALATGHQSLSLVPIWLSNLEVYERNSGAHRARQACDVLLAKLPAKCSSTQRLLGCTVGRHLQCSLPPLFECSGGMGLPLIAVFGTSLPAPRRRCVAQRPLGAYAFKLSRQHISVVWRDVLF